MSPVHATMSQSERAEFLRPVGPGISAQAPRTNDQGAFLHKHHGPMIKGHGREQSTYAEQFLETAYIL